MGDILDKIFAVILVVILMFFFPLLDAFERIDDLSYMTVYAATVKFVDAVRLTGNITPEMYTEFMQKLNSTGNKYSIEMSHKKSMYYPKEDTYVIQYTENNHVLLDEEFNTEQILYKMGYYEYDSANSVLVDKIPTKTYANFSVGDYFYVSVKNMSATPATVIKRVIYGTNVTDLAIMVPYGGLVQNDSKRELIDVEYAGTVPEEEGIRLASMVEIGDYVRYIPDSATTRYTILASESGHSANQTITRQNINWRVLKIDGNVITLISESPIDTISLKGKLGYLNGPYMLNNMYRALYSGSKGTARNLNIEDVNELTGYTPNIALYRNNSNQQIEIPYGTQVKDLENSLGISLTYRETPNGIDVGECKLSDYGYSANINNMNSVQYNLIFNTGAWYWLSSSSVDLWLNENGADFDMRTIFGGDVAAANLYYSNGKTPNNSYKSRPIVILNSGVEIDEEASGDGKSVSGAWVLK